MNKPTFSFPVILAALDAALVSSPKHTEAASAIRNLNKAIPIINEAYEAGEIVKSVSKDARDYLNRFVEGAYKIVLAEAYLYGGKWESQPEGVREISYVYEARLIGSFQKKVAKLADCEFKSAALAFCAELKVLQDVVEYLKTIEISAAAKVAKVRAVKAEEQRVAFDTDVVYQAVLPLKKAAQDRAEEQLRKAFANAGKLLARAEFKLSVVAPEPTEKYGSLEYDAALARRSFFASFTKPVANGSDVVSVDLERIEQKVELERVMAGMSFDSFVHKLNLKINDTTLKATLSGSPWSGSTLMVETKNKGTQVWYTKVIVNCSKLGKVFNQFPTRLAK
jgi:hypothetical protein